MKKPIHKIPSYRFTHENSARSLSRGINEVLYWPGETQCLRPGVEPLGWNEAHAVGFHDPMFVEGMPERMFVLLVRFEDGEEAWFHFNPCEAVEMLP